VSATTALVGSTITVGIANGLGLPGDWVTLAEIGAADSSYVAWQYLNGTTTLPATGFTSATLKFAAPAVPGTYVVRLFANGGWTKLATSALVTVQTANPPTLTPLTAMTTPGGAISVTLANGLGLRSDWVSLA